MKSFKFHLVLSSLAVLLLTSCGGNPEKEDQPASITTKDTIIKTEADTKSFKGKKVPVLCYHAIRELQKSDSGDKKAYSVSPENFALQMKTLSNNGYTSITPDQLKDFYTNHQPLPEKPIMITFDDGRKEQYTIAAEILEKYNFKGVFFIMTVSLGKKLFMSRDDVKALSDRGHVIGSHTWDHHMVTHYKGDDWKNQLIKPKKKLEEITQKAVTSFAYPHGVWNDIAADSLKRYGFTTAFLFGGKQDATRPLYTFERMNVPYSMGIGGFVRTVENIGKAD
jgi:peptidoglycan/xylan/chitin deacetylase (PgdA/CDA1 family)